MSMEGHQNNAAPKRKKKTRNESVLYSESPPSKKRKELKASTNNELQSKQKRETEEDVTISSDVEHNNKHVKKKKSKQKEEMKQKTGPIDEADTMMEPEVGSCNRSEDLVKKKKKKHKNKHHRNDNAFTDEVEQEEADVLVESELGRSNNVQELVKKKKKSKHNLEDEAFTDDGLGWKQRRREADVRIQSASESSNRSEDLVKKKHKNKHHRNDNAFTDEVEQEEADVLVESELGSCNNVQELVKKKKKKKKKSKHNLEDEAFTDDGLGWKRRRREADVRIQSASESSNRSEDLVKKKKPKKKSNTTMEQNTAETPTVPNVIQRDTNPLADEDLPSFSGAVNIGVRRKRSSRGEHLEDDEVLLEQIKEFVPDIESKATSNIGKLIKYDLPRFEEFKRKGIPISLGRFTRVENATLRKNVEDFMALTGVDSSTKLFFPFRYKDEEEQIKRLKRQHRFFQRITEGIPRSCYNIYSRGRKMFDDQQYKGRFLEDELHQLLRLHTLHGSNWKKISELTDRSALSLQKRFAQLSKKIGIWSKTEVQRLLKAVQDYVVSQLPRNADSNTPVQVRKETLYRYLPWQDISAKVKTRSWSKCRQKWMYYLASKMSSGSIFTEKTALDIKIKLIKAMYETEVDDVARLDWEEMADVIGNVPPSYVQMKWHRIKASHVPEWQTKCFADTVDFLYEKVLPHLEQKFSVYKDCTDVQENRESFLLTDIFQDCNGEQNDDSDED